MRTEIIAFPNPELADRDGLLVIGGDVSVENLMSAYQKGIFPWPMGEEYPVTWFSPDPRGVLFLKNARTPKSFSKFLKKTNYEVTKNQCFEKVLLSCVEVRNHETWITSEIHAGYCELFKQGLAYSYECWDAGTLVGGLYGVKMGDFYSGESMFHLKSNASKFCLYHLIQDLISQKTPWIDIQMVTPVLELFGGENIKRSDYLSLLPKVRFVTND